MDIEGAKKRADKRRRANQKVFNDRQATPELAYYALGTAFEMRNNIFSAETLRWSEKTHSAAKEVRSARE